MTHLQKKALIIDDEEDIRELLSLTLTRMDIDPIEAENIAEAKKALQQHSIDVCLTDMRLPDGNGLDFIQYLQTQYPHIPVAMITAYGNMESAIQALKAGAFDFVSKPIELTTLRQLVESALKLSHHTALSASHTGQKHPDQPQLLGNSPSMQKTRQLIQKLARSEAPVYIRGESGTGKEIAAKLIHLQSSRKDNAFVPINCGAIPSELMESEFFGHTKGSFTGAISDKPGFFHIANGGTLFLDEIADLPIAMQVKLLRAIQEKSFRPIGSQKEQQTNVRIISATHKDLEKLVSQGHFRQDLYYRINVIELPMPPLRERKEDILLLSEHILQRIHRSSIRLSEAAKEQLMHYTFPGNVRELENILERASTLCNHPVIEVSDMALPSSHTSPPPQYTTDIPPSPASEEAMILHALERTQWNRKAAAKILGLTYRQLRYRLHKMQRDKK